MSILTHIASSIILGASPPPSEIKRLDGTRISVTKAHHIAESLLIKHKVMGAQILIINHGKVVWSESFGKRGINPDLPIQNETILWAASLTKPVFATCVMSLAEKGILDLDMPVAKQLKQPLDQYEDYKEQGAQIIKEPGWKSVTPRMLMNHTSGLINFAFLEPDKLMHLHSTPGTTFRYSGEGMNLLQLLIEEKTGRGLEDLMQASIFQPCGMTRTSMAFKPSLGTNIADRFDHNSKFLSQTRRSRPRGAGSMTTTAEDYARFLLAFSTHRIVSAKTYSKMFANRVKINSLHQFPLSPNEPEGSEGTKVGLSYGLGWGYLSKTKFGPAFFKEGHGDGAQNYAIFFEKSKSGIVILTNSDNGELAFRELNEELIGNSVTPWEWEGYTPSYIATTRKS